MKKTQTQILMSLILGLAAATTLPQVYAENRQQVEDSSAAAIA